VCFDLGDSRKEGRNRKILVTFGNSVKKGDTQPLRIVKDSRGGSNEKREKESRACRGKVARTLKFAERGKKVIQTRQV